MHKGCPKAGCGVYVPMCINPQAVLCMLEFEDMCSECPGPLSQHLLEAQGELMQVSRGPSTALGLGA